MSQEANGHHSEQEAVVPKGLSYITQSTLLGETMNWVIQLSPYIPENLTDIAKAVDMYITNKKSHSFEKVVFYRDIVMIGYKDDHQMHTFLHEMSHTLPELKVLNLSKKERDDGLTVEDVDNDEKREGSFIFTSRYNGINKEYDFVDLGALARNISNNIRWDKERNDKFDEEFENKHGKLDTKDY